MKEEASKFKPLTASHGNVSGEIAYLRNTFLSAEMDYFKELLTIENNRDLLVSLLDYSPDKLYSEAQRRIGLIESGEVKEEDLDREEGTITFLLAAIQDKVRLLELVKTMDEEQEHSQGHSQGRGR